MPTNGCSPCTTTISSLSSIHPSACSTLRSVAADQIRPGSTPFGPISCRCSTCSAKAAGSMPTARCGPTRPRRLSSATASRSEEHTSELQAHVNLVCRLLLEKKKELLIRPILVQPVERLDHARDLADALIV